MSGEPEDRWDLVRRQVALYGRVTSGATGMAVADADVWIVDDRRSNPPAATVRPDGLYFFLDLPPGRYVVAAEDRRGRLRGSATGEVSCDEKGNVQAVAVDLELRAADVTRAPASPIERPRARAKRQEQRRKSTG